jgi:hypothetical protein
VNNTNKKRFLFNFLLAFIFFWVTTVGPDLVSLLNSNGTYKVVYAKPKSSSGGFKSGSFKSSGGSSLGGFKSGSFSVDSKSKSGGSSSGSYKPGSSTSGGYKSGSFSNTKKNTPSSSEGYNSYPSGETKRSYIPLPIPIPWGGYSSYGPSYYGPVTSIISAFFTLIKLIIIIAIIYYIIRKFRRR